LNEVPKEERGRLMWKKRANMHEERKGTLIGKYWRDQNKTLLCGERGKGVKARSANEGGEGRQKKEKSPLRKKPAKKKGVGSQSDVGFATSPKLSEREISSRPGTKQKGAGRGPVVG